MPCYVANLSETPGIPCFLPIPALMLEQVKTGVSVTPAVTPGDRHGFDGSKYKGGET